MSHAIVPRASRRLALLAGVVVALALFALLSVLAARGPYEGDDINSYVPMAYLDAARDGLFEIYRYAWQPLSYEVGSALYRATGSITSVQLLPAAAIAVLTGLILAFGLRRGVPALLTLSALVAAPEVLFTGLYWNASAPAALVAAIGGVVLIAGRGVPTALIAGLCLSLAALLRMDFILISPVFFMLAVASPAAQLPRAAAVTGAALAVMLAAWALGVLTPAELIDTWQISAAEIAAKSDTPGWDRARKTWVLAVALSPLGFAAIALAAATQAVSIARRDHVLMRLGFLMALLPSLWVVPSLLSAKYLMPFTIALALIALRFWHRVPQGLASAAHVAAPPVALALLFVAVEPERSPPFLSLAISDLRIISTHDGPRTHGAYIHPLSWVAQRASKTDRDGVRIAEALGRPEVESISVLGPESWFSPGGAGWRAAISELMQGPHRIEVLGGGMLDVVTPQGRLRLSRDAVLPADCTLDLSTPEAADRSLAPGPLCDG